MLTKVDSYKLSHTTQNPPDTQIKNSYIEARGGAFGYTVMFGLQAWIDQNLHPDQMPAKGPLGMDDIGVFAANMRDHFHGDVFNTQEWRALTATHPRALPLIIEALPEGTIVPHGTPMVQVRNTDMRFPWLPAYIETSLLRAIWYPSTVATLSREIKKSIYRALEATSDDPKGQIPFKLHDFGARGASSGETAALGGLAHLVNFKGTDTVEALVAAAKYYDCAMAGNSIAATEHSIACMYGRNGEADYVRMMINHYGKQMFACVGDSYDIFNFCENVVGGELKTEIENMGGTIVVRPDSGEPAAVVLEVMRILARKFGTKMNGKGYQVLPPCVRVIQGDGVNYDSIQTILTALRANNFSIDNIAFGMGGALLQNVNRDTCKFAMKTSAALVNGQWIDVYKDPVGDKSKTSKRGVQGVYADGERLVVRSRSVGQEGGLLQEVWRNGHQRRPRVTLDEVRARAEIF